MKKIIVPQKSPERLKKKIKEINVDPDLKKKLEGAVGTKKKGAVTILRDWIREDQDKDLIRKLRGIK